MRPGASASRSASGLEGRYRGRAAVDRLGGLAYRVLDGRNLFGFLILHEQEASHRQGREGQRKQDRDPSLLTQPSETRTTGPVRRARIG